MAGQETTQPARDRRPRRYILAAASALLVLAAVAAYFIGTEHAAAPPVPMICDTDSVSRSLQRMQATIPNLALASLDGRPVPLHSLTGQRLTVLVFGSATCPCSDGYADRLGELRSVYTPRGVSFAAIFANSDETVSQIKGYVSTKRYPLPVFLDDLQALADTLHAAVTPEVFVFGPDWRLSYHGRIDDDKSGLLVSDRSLALALDTLLVDRPLLVREKPALGCAIRR